MPSLFIRADLYERLSEYAWGQGHTVTSVVEELLADLPPVPGREPDPEPNRATGRMRPRCPCCPGGCRHAFEFRGTLRCDCKGAVPNPTCPCCPGGCRCAFFYRGAPRCDCPKG